MTLLPDDCPDRLSELAILAQGAVAIPTVIPTKCRDTTQWSPCSAGFLRREGNPPKTRYTPVEKR